MAIYYLIDRPATKSNVANICFCLIFFSVSIYLLFLVGLRGAVIAVLVTCMFMVTIGRSSRRQKGLVSLYIIAVSVLSYNSLGAERIDHYKSIERTASSLINRYKNNEDWLKKLADSAELSSSCRVKSDGVATRLLLFEKTSALIQEFPLFGVGVGRWGIVTKCSGHFGTPHTRHENAHV